MLQERWFWIRDIKMVVDYDPTKMTTSNASIRRESRQVDATPHVIIIETDDVSDDEATLTPKTMRRYMETISESDADESDEDSLLFRIRESHSKHSVDESSTTSTRRSSVIGAGSQRSSICGDKLTPQEEKFIEQMRLLRKFVRERNNLIAGGSTGDADPEASQFVPPDGGWGWMVVLGSALVFFFGGGLSRCFTLIYLQFLEVFEQSAAATSATAAIFGAVKMCTSPLVSMLCARFSKRSVAMSGGVVTCVAMVMTSYPLSLEYVYFSYGILAAFGMNMVLTPCFIILSEYFKKRRARAMSIAMLGGSLGGMALPPLLTYLLDSYGYSGAMLIYSGLMLNICLAGTLFRPVVLRSREEVEKEKERKRERKEEARRAKECTCNGHKNGVVVATSPAPDTTDLSNGECPVCRPEDDEEDDDERPPSDHDDDYDDVPSLHLMDRHKKRLADLNSVESGSGYISSKPDMDTASTATGDGDPTRPLRKRRVSFQLSTVTKVIPANSYDSEDGDEDDSETESTEPSACRQKLAWFLHSFGFHLFKKPRFLFYSLLMMASILCLSISGTFLSGLVSDMNMDKSLTSIMLSASAILDVPSKFASGFIFDMKRIRPYRSLPLAILGFVTGSFALGIGFSADFVQLFVTFMIYNFFASAYHTQHATVLADLVGAENLSAAMGLCRLCQGIGICLGPTIGGHLKDVTGRYQNAYIFSGCVLITATLVYTTVDQWFLWRQRRIERAAYFPKGHYARYRSDSIAVT